MGLRTTTDAAAILDVLDPVVAADPVRHTVLATIAADVRAGSPGWCATDGAAVAARSSPALPVPVTEGWSDLDALAGALAGVPQVRALRGPVPVVAALVGRWGRPVLDGHEERLFRCDELTAPRDVPGTARRAGPADAPLLEAWRTPFLIDAFGRVPPGTDLGSWAPRALAGGVWLWDDPEGRPVSQAATRPSMAGAARVGPVYTPPEHRGRGYASAVTAAATAEALDIGAVPVLFTDLANPTSNKIYEALGYRPVEDCRLVWFE